MSSVRRVAAASRRLPRDVDRREGALLLASVESVTAPGASGLDMGASGARASPASESPSALRARTRTQCRARREPADRVHDGPSSYIGARSDADTFTSA